MFQSREYFKQVPTHNSTAPQPPSKSSHYMEWIHNRNKLENSKIKSHPRKYREETHWFFISILFDFILFFLKTTGLFKLLKQRPLNIQLSRLELSFPELPLSFDGYKLLHISDPHFDCAEKTALSIIHSLPEETVDWVIWTGDYCDRCNGSFTQVIELMKHAVHAIHPREGQIAVLGNHDSANMVPELEKLGLRVLINETITVQRREGQLHFTGLDDVNYYYSEKADQALNSSPNQGFKIALVHSNEMCPVAEKSGYHLYLCGHSHGGQICTPWGRPILTHCDMKTSLSSGCWKYGSMTGVTSKGAGMVKIPIRIFCQAEITLITLRHKSRERDS